MEEPTSGLVGQSSPGILDVKFKVVLMQDRDPSRYRICDNHLSSSGGSKQMVTTGPTPPEGNPNPSDLIVSHRQQLTIYVELYKNHFDLWLKAQALYVAIQGTAAGLAGRGDILLRARLSVLFFACICSGFALAGGVITRKWLLSTEDAIARSAAVLDVEPIRLTLAKQTVIFGQAMAFVLLVCGLVLCFQLE